MTTETKTETKTIHACVDARNMGIACILAKNSQYYDRYLAFGHGGTYVTDGKMLTHVPYAEPSDFSGAFSDSCPPVLASASSLKELPKINGHHGEARIAYRIEARADWVKENQNEVSISFLTGIQTMKTPTTSYPTEKHMQQLLTPEEGAKTYTFSVDVLERTLKTAKAAGCTAIETSVSSDPCKPIYWVGRYGDCGSDDSDDCGRRARGVFLPMVS